jgi:transposase InsO family protein
MGSIKFSQSQKKSILDSAAEIGIKQAADLAGVHYTSVYDWRRQLESLGEQGFLTYKPSYPGRGTKQITADQERAVLETWKRNSGFGPGQVRNQLRRQGKTISIRTVRRIMQANGYQVPGKRSANKEVERFEATCPLELAQMDILEFFITKLKVYMLLLLDDYSRFILGWQLLCETSVDAVIGLVQAAIYRYGKMQEILTDRGFIFYSWHGINRFEKYLEVEGIDHTHARPHHPQTLGKVEALNKRLKGELIDQKHFSTVHEAETAIGNWVEHYNYKRTHQGIGGFLVPAERFHGQAEQVLAAVAEGIDVTDHNGYNFSGIERSVVNLMLSPDGKLTLYVVGRPIVLKGADHGK